MKTPRTAGAVLLVVIAILCWTATGWASLPEPDVVYYGTALSKGFWPADEKVSLVLDATAETVASYMPGTVSTYGDAYVLRVPMDALDSIEGESANLYIGDVLAGETIVPAKGTVVELNLDTLYNKDSDHDGMEDNWELAYFGSLERDGTGDMNDNGISDLDEYRNGTDPTAAHWVAVSGDYVAACVSHPLVLQNALTEAGEDERHNLIKVRSGLYAGNFVYSAAADEPFDLTLVGGYGEACEARLAGPGTTVLDGDADTDGSGDGPVLSVDTATGGVRIQGFHVKNGEAPNDEGGGLQIVSGAGKVEIVGNLIMANTALKGGGMAVTTVTGDLFVADNVFVENVSTEPGGAMALDIQGSAERILIANNTIEANTGGGVLCKSAFSTPMLMNNIISNTLEGEGIRVEGGEEPAGDYNLFWNNESGDYNLASFQGEHDLAVDPGFTDPENKDFSLLAASACIDAGNNVPWLTPLDHQLNPRIMDGDGDSIYRVDLGACEWGDGLPGGCNPLQDTDCDGFSNDLDICLGFDDGFDVDGDGIPDGCDKWPGEDDKEMAADGDTNGDTKIDLADAILCLKCLSRCQISVPVFKGSDVNGDGKIGFAEVIYIFRIVSDGK